MVKLIRLVGNADSTGSSRTKEIQNTFRDNIFIKPNSRIALRSCFAEFDGENQVREFPITTDDSFQYKLKVQGSGNNIKIQPSTTAGDLWPTGDYTDLSTLLRNMQVATNGTFPNDISANVYSGIHTRWLRTATDRAAFRVYQSNLDNANFSTEWVNSEGDDSGVVKGVSRLDFNGVTSDGQPCVFQSTFLTPALSHESTWITTDVTDGAGNFAEYEWNMVENDAPTNVLWSVKLDDAGAYSCFVGSTQVGQTTIPADNDDVISVKKQGATMTFTLTLQGGGPIGSLLLMAAGSGYDNGTFEDVDVIGGSGTGATVDITVIGNAVTVATINNPGSGYASGDTLTIQGGNNDATVSVGQTGKTVFTATIPNSLLQIQNISNEIKLINTGGLTPLQLDDAEVMIIDQLEPDQLSSTSPVDVTLEFESNLGPLLGFHDDTYTKTGDPAQFLSNVPPPGSLKNPGIMVAIDGLDLESYSGVQVGGGLTNGHVNFLDVIYPTHERPNEIQYFADFPVPLFMKNNREINLKDLRISFVKQVDGTRATFRGSPVVVLEIYDPDEST